MMKASFRCTSCGEPVALTPAGFLFGKDPIPSCPCQDVVTCADCGARFDTDWDWVQHCVNDH